MADYTLKVRRYEPESGEGAYWQDFDVSLDGTLSVLDGLLQAKAREDGSRAVRCSCRAAICGSCGVKINGESVLACKTQLGHAHDESVRQSQFAQTPPARTREHKKRAPAVGGRIHASGSGAAGRLQL